MVLKVITQRKILCYWLNRYNLRASVPYQRQRRGFEKNQARQVAIGERRKPQVNGQLGYIRIDSVHQGDLDKQKGGYQINAIDDVTQFEVVFSVERISEHFMVPALGHIFGAFLFVIQGFYSDNGSEYINKRIEKLLNKLLIAFT